MKVKVFVTGDTGVDAVSRMPSITSIPDRIYFSEEEIYESIQEMTYDSFVRRLNNDVDAKPKVTACTKKKFAEIMDSQIQLGYDYFIFFVTDDRQEPYIEWINEFRTNHPIFTVITQLIDSFLYPAVFIAQEQESMMRKGYKEIQTEDMIRYYDMNNTTYIFSPTTDYLIRTDRKDTDQDTLIAPPKSSMYIVRGGDVGTHRMKGRNKQNIAPLLDEYREDVDGKDVIPYILYSNVHSRILETYQRFLMDLFPNLKSIKCFPFSPNQIMRFGKNAIGIGFLLKKESN